MAGVGLFAVRRKKRSTCEQCGAKMVLLNEDDDDAHLTEGEQAEEILGSVDYDVWACPACEHAAIYRDSRWFTSYKTCGSCANKTAQTTRETLVVATTAHGGEVRITKTCMHCDASSSTTRRTPKVSATTSSTRSRRSEKRSERMTTHP